MGQQRRALDLGRDGERGRLERPIRDTFNGLTLPSPPLLHPLISPSSPLNPLPRPPFPALGNAEVNPLRPVYPPLPCDEDVLVEEGVSYRSSARRFAAADQIVVFFSHKSPRAPFSCHKLQLWIYSLL